MQAPGMNLHNYTQWYPWLHHIHVHEHTVASSKFMQYYTITASLKPAYFT